MADLGGTFNPNEVPEDERSFDPIPAGEYVCQIVESDLFRVKSNQGDALKLTLEVLEGPFANRKIWDQLNIRHENPQTQSIAQRALADLCQALGITSLRNSEELHFKPFIARIAIDQDKAKQYPPKNAVKRYRPRSGQPPAAKAPAKPAQAQAQSQQTQQATPAQQPAAAPSGGYAQAKGNRPWARPSA